MNADNNETSKKNVPDPTATTGTGFSERERSGVDPRKEGIAHKGSDELASTYNLDEQALLDSSIDDFVLTTSKFKHSDGSTGSDENK